VPDPVSGELLSAHLDGALSPAEEAEVEAARSDAAVAEELEALGQVRALVRDLPEVEPPPGFLESLTAAPPAGRVGRGGRGTWVASGAAAAAALVLAVGVVPQQPAAALVPELDHLRDQHAAAIAGELTTTAPEDADGFEPPPTLGAATLAEVAVEGDVVQALYRDGDGSVSVFAEPGRIDWPHIPANGEELVVDGDRGWRWLKPGPSLVVVGRGDVVYTVVSADEAVDVVAVASALPAQVDGDGLGDRLQDGCTGVVESLGFEL
jgi:hypothetical protein